MEIVQHGDYDYQRLVDIALKSLWKEYRLKLQNIRLDSGCCDDDWVKNLVTMRVTLSR